MFRNFTLHSSVANSDIPGVETHLNNGAGIDTPGKSGLTPIMIAAMYGNLGMIKFLLEKGADINFLSEHRCLTVTGEKNLHRSALVIALNFGHKHVALELLARGANPQPAEEYFNAFPCNNNYERDQNIRDFLNERKDIDAKRSALQTFFSSSENGYDVPKDLEKMITDYSEPSLRLR